MQEKLFFTWYFTIILSTRLVSSAVKPTQCWGIWRGVWQFVRRQAGKQMEMAGGNRRGRRVRGEDGEKRLGAIKGKMNWHQDKQSTEETRTDRQLIPRAFSTPARGQQRACRSVRAPRSQGAHFACPLHRPPRASALPVAHLLLFCSQLQDKNIFLKTREHIQLKMECATLNREGAGLAKPPKHLWRQPRTHIRIKQRFNSDTERYLCRNRTLEKLRPGLKKPRMSWPSSLRR